MRARVLFKRSIVRPAHVAFLVYAALVLPGHSQNRIMMANVKELEQILGDKEGFEDQPYEFRIRPLPDVTQMHAAQYGSKFDGQKTTNRGPFDILRNTPTYPLELASDGPRANLALANFDNFWKVRLVGGGQSFSQRTPLWTRAVLQ